MESLRMAHQGNWQPGIKYLGLKEGALDYAVDVHNKHLITKDLVEQVEIAKERITRGIIEVDMYSPN